MGASIFFYPCFLPRRICSIADKGFFILLCLRSSYVSLQVFSWAALCPIAIAAILAKIRPRSANLKRKSSLLQYELGPAKKKARLDHILKREEDLISQLPDDILVSILSRMSTKNAAKTSLLSRRWRNLHRFLPVYHIELSCFYLLKHVLLDFGTRTEISLQRWRSLYGCLSKIEFWFGYILAEMNPHSSGLLVNSLDRFLRLHSGYKIHSFSLRCCFNKSVTGRFERSICSLRRLGVEKLVLECCCSPRNSDLSFSCRLLSKIPSLKYFQLSKCSLRPSLRSRCSSLQTIVLMYVRVYPGAVECILSNCLRLHSLTIDSCKCPRKLSFCGPRLELKSLYINDCDRVEEIEFYASNLVVIEFWNYDTVNLIFDHVPKLESVYLYIYSEHIVRYVFGRLALDLPHLKSLNFVTACHHIQESSINMEINMFSKLRRLHIDMKSLLKIDLLLLTSILHHCPLLQDFHLNVNYSGNGPQSERQGVVFHSELKNMEIDGFWGLEYEMEFALYILKSAINLEKMHISRCFRDYEGSLTGSGGRWCRRPAIPWSEETEGMIHTRLRGQAVSKIAQVVIQHEPPLKREK